MDEKSSWSVEHYGFAPSAAAEDPQGRAEAVGPRVRAGWSQLGAWRGRAAVAIAGGVLSLALVGGAGGYAVAQAATSDGSGPVAGHQHGGHAGPARDGVRDHR